MFTNLDIDEHENSKHEIEMNTSRYLNSFIEPKIEELKIADENPTIRGSQTLKIKNPEEFLQIPRSMSASKLLLRASRKVSKSNNPMRFNKFIQTLKKIEKANSDGIGTYS